MPDPEIFNRGMLLLTYAYPDYDLPPTTMDLYREFLRGLSNLDFEKAVKGHILKHKWFPKVSELLDIVRSFRLTAHDAWNILLKRAEAGDESPPEIEGALAATAAGLDAVGGWQHFSTTSYKELSFAFKVFQEAFQREQDKEELLPALPPVLQAAARNALEEP